MLDRQVDILLLVDRGELQMNDLIHVQTPPRTCYNVDFVMCEMGKGSKTTFSGYSSTDQPIAASVENICLEDG